jgi:hypothetical protein
LTSPRAARKMLDPNFMVEFLIDAQLLLEMPEILEKGYGHFIGDTGYYLYPPSYLVFARIATLFNPFVSTPVATDVSSRQSGTP